MHTHTHIYKYVFFIFSTVITLEWPAEGALLSWWVWLWAFRILSWINFIYVRLQQADSSWPITAAQCLDQEAGLQKNSAVSLILTLLMVDIVDNVIDVVTDAVTTTLMWSEAVPGGRGSC